ncbi:MAG TPA: hypothetical protein VGO50_08065 [Pyrinomonadaceae bacterium]|jgi:hypothetical protein|nr:hypothetical protein [Pyrinomonadaceae bacterium]
MKSVKNILAMVAMVTVMGVSSSFAGVYWADRNGGDTNVCTKDGDSANGGILIGDFAASLGGILIGDFAATGILIGDLADDACSSDSANGGIMIGD